MKYVLTIFYFCLLNLSVNAVPNPTTYGHQKVSATNTLTFDDFILSNNKDWAKKIGKKLSWKEKIALNILRKKVRKAAKADPAILNKSFQSEQKKFNINDFALLAGISSISSLILAGILGSGIFAFLSIIIAPIAVITGLIGLALNKPRRSKAIWGLVLGLLISGLWLWIYNTIG